MAERLPGNRSAYRAGSPLAKRKTEKKVATNRGAASKFYLPFLDRFSPMTEKEREKKKTKCRSLAAPVCPFLKNHFPFRGDNPFDAFPRAILFYSPLFLRVFFHPGLIIG